MSIGNALLFCHPELAAKSVETKSKRDFMPLPGVSGSINVDKKTGIDRFRNKFGMTGEGAERAFTLAEVLITLGIIGVVAAMTMPALIGHYKKVEIETKLKRFYSMANQAVQFAELEHGPKTEWNFATEACKTDSYGEQCLTEFFEKYLKKNFKYTKAEYDTSKKGLFIYLADGSMILLGYRGKDYLYYTNAQKALDGTDVSCKDSFLFGFYPDYPWKESRPLSYKHYRNKGIEPYISDTWDGNWDTIYNRTENCTYAILHNGWKIPDDYPIKF